MASQRSRAERGASEPGPRLASPIALLGEPSEMDDGSEQSSVNLRCLNSILDESGHAGDLTGYAPESAPRAAPAVCQNPLSISRGDELTDAMLKMSCDNSKPPQNGTTPPFAEMSSAAPSGGASGWGDVPKFPNNSDCSRPYPESIASSASSMASNPSSDYLSGFVGHRFSWQDATWGVDHGATPAPAFQGEPERFDPTGGAAGIFSEDSMRQRGAQSANLNAPFHGTHGLLSLPQERAQLSHYTQPQDGTQLPPYGKVNATTASFNPSEQTLGGNEDPNCFRQDLMPSHSAQQAWEHRMPSGQGPVPPHPSQHDLQQELLEAQAQAVLESRLNAQLTAQLDRVYRDNMFMGRPDNPYDWRMLQQQMQNPQQRQLTPQMQPAQHMQSLQQIPPPPQLPPHVHPTQHMPNRMQMPPAPQQSMPIAPHPPMPMASQQQAPLLPPGGPTPAQLHQAWVWIAQAHLQQVNAAPPPEVLHAFEASVTSQRSQQVSNPAQEPNRHTGEHAAVLQVLDKVRAMYEQDAFASSRAPSHPARNGSSGFRGSNIQAALDRALSETRFDSDAASEHSSSSESSHGNDSHHSRRHRHNQRGGDRRTLTNTTFDIAKVISGEDRRTTVMMRNIPNMFSQKTLLCLMDANHAGKFDLVYLPIDFENKCNVGYAFINFTSYKSLPAFYEEFNGRKWSRFSSNKVAQINYARIQGKDALMAHFSNSSLCHEDESMQPAIFRSDGSGIREPWHHLHEPRRPRQ